MGCGNGNATHATASIFPKATYTLVDASQDMLELCKVRFRALNVNYVNSYFNDFTFKNNSYDLVIAGFSLHHCTAAEKPVIYKKIYKALKPNGIFACSDLMINKKEKTHQNHIEDWKAFVMKSFSNEEKWNWLMEHYNEFDNPNNIVDHIHWLRKTGFKDFSLNAYDNYWTHFKALKSL